MTVYRCNQCGAVAETTQAHGSETVCANCQQPVQVLDTVLYIFRAGAIGLPRLGG